VSAPAPSIVVADVHSYSAASDRPFALQRATLGSPAPPGQRHLVRQHAEQALERVDGYASQRPALSDWVALAGEQNVELRARAPLCRAQSLPQSASTLFPTRPRSRWLSVTRQ
jgi:hypothetical protein